MSRLLKVDLPMLTIRQGIVLALLPLSLMVSSLSSGTDAVKTRPATSAITLDVYKSPTCGCCKLWIDHAQHAGLQARIIHPDDMNSIKQQHQINPRYQSCHTAVSKNQFIFEGHVPSRYIQKFLASPPEGAVGLAVPGMPLGSPGMEVDTRFTPYQVLLLKKDGSSSIFADVASPADQ